MSRVVVSAEAQEDLRSIRERIELDRPRSAVKVLQSLRKAILQLAEFPRMGHLRPDLTDAPVRFYTVGGFTIVYRPEPPPLTIARVFAKGQDIRTQLER